MELTFDIIEYIGRMDGGVFVLLNLNVDNTDFYDAVFYYKENTVALTVDEKFEELIGSQIEDFKRPASFYWQPICSIKSL